MPIAYKPKYILWNPDSEKPPKKIFTSRKDAESCARWACGRSPNETFFVCELLSSFTQTTSEPEETNQVL